MIFSIPIIPVPKARARSSRGHHYTPQKTRDFEAAVKAFAIKAAVEDKWVIPEHPVTISLVFYVSRLRGDLDNLCKSILDPLRGVIVKDDNIRYIRRLIVDVVKVEKGEEKVSVLVFS